MLNDPPKSLLALALHTMRDPSGVWKVGVCCVSLPVKCCTVTHAFGFGVAVGGRAVAVGPVRVGVLVLDAAAPVPGVLLLLLLVAATASEHTPQTRISAPQPMPAWTARDFEVNQFSCFAIQSNLLLCSSGLWAIRRPLALMRVGCAPQPSRSRTSRTDASTRARSDVPAIH